MTELHWRAALSDSEQHQVQRLVEAAASTDGVSPVGERVLRELSRDGTGHLLAVESGEIIGYLNLAEGTVEVAVAPGARRRGVGARLARAALDRGGEGVRFWAHGTVPAAMELARTLGLRPVRELLQMRRSLRSLPESVPPQGYRISTYPGSEVHDELLRVNNAAFSWHPEQGGWTQSDLVERIGSPWFDPAGLFLAVDDADGRLLGFHWTKVHDERLGEVYVVGVDPEAQGRGVGRALMLAGINHLAGRLASAPEAEVMLYVESDNAAAVNTYRGLGFEVSGVDTAYAPPATP